MAEVGEPQLRHGLSHGSKPKTSVPSRLYSVPGIRYARAIEILRPSGRLFGMLAGQPLAGTRFLPYSPPLRERFLLTVEQFQDLSVRTAPRHFELILWSLHLEGAVVGRHQWVVFAPLGLSERGHRFPDTYQHVRKLTKERT